MKSKKSNKTNENPENILDKAYNCKSNGLQKLLEEIEAKIKSDGNNETFSRAKSIITTKMILKQEKNIAQSS